MSVLLLKKWSSSTLVLRDGSTYSNFNMCGVKVSKRLLQQICKTYKARKLILISSLDQHVGNHYPLLVLFLVNSKFSQANQAKYKIKQF